MADWKLLCLGRPILEMDGKPVKLEMRKSLALLVYLRLAEHDFSRDFLAALFWPEFDQQHAMANLRRALSSLNKCLPAKILDADREKIGLIGRSTIWVDLELFHELLNQWKYHTHSNEPVCEQCLLTVEKAVRLYRGDFLEGFNLEDCPQFDEWQVTGRENAKRELGQMLQFLSETYANQSNWDKAIEYANRWVILDQLHEPAQRLLMHIQNQTGQRKASLRRYEDLVKSLHDEIGQEPETETTDLYFEIRDGKIPSGQSKGKEAPPKALLAQTSEPILKTKLFIPKVSQKAIRRLHLVKKMDQGIQGSLTLISAPAGYGKTTLLVEWASYTHLPVGWFSIDKADNDPNRFLTYLITALSSLKDGIGNECMQLLQTTQSIPSQTLLALLLKDLEAISDKLVVILDDYHCIQSESIHEIVTYLLEHMPACLHLVIATRADPPIHLAKLRSKGQMLELRLNDLRFQITETDQLLNQIMKLDLDTQQIATLETRTEGWVVGLQMAGIALTSIGTSKDQFIQSFSGSNRHILDYLIDEVLSQQPENIQSFLFQTAILDRLCTPLCNALTAVFETGVNTALPISHSSKSSISAPSMDCQQILEYLERTNLFLIPLDEDRRWYRYHHLFSDLLLMRLRLANPELEKKLHDRASIWYEQAGLINKSIQHAFSGLDKKRPSQLILKHSLFFLAKGELLTVHNWISALPEKLVMEQPWLCIYKAWVGQVLNRISKSASYLDHAEKSIRPDTPDGQEMTIHINVLRSDLAIREGDFDRAGALAQEGYRLLSGDQSILQWGLLRWTALILIGYVYLIQLKMEQSEKVYLEAHHFASNTDNLYIYTFSVDNLTELYRFQGRLHDAEKAYQAAIQRGIEQYGRQTILLGCIYAYYSSVLYEWNDLDLALQYAQEGIRGAERLGRAKPWIMGYVYLSQILQARGDLSGAGKAIEEASRLTQNHKIPPLNMSQLNSQLRRYKQAAGMIDPSSDIQILDFRSDNRNPTFEDCFNLVEKARLLLNQRKVKESLKWLSEVVELLRPLGPSTYLIKAMILRACGLHEIGKEKQALQIFGECLILAEPEGMIRTFLDEGPRAAQLFEDYVKDLPSQIAAPNIQIKIFIAKLMKAYKLEEPIKT